MSFISVISCKSTDHIGSVALRSLNWLLPSCSSSLSKYLTLLSTTTDSRLRDSGSILYANLLLIELTGIYFIIRVYVLLLSLPT